MISCREYASIKKEEYKNCQEKMSLSIVQIGEDPASNTYVKGKIKDCEEVGIKTYLFKLPKDIDQSCLNRTVGLAVYDEQGIIIPFPIPKHLEIDKLLIRPRLDVDGLFYDYYNPCTPEGIIDWLEYNNIELSNKHVVIIGRGKLVGKPLAQMMLDKNATVSLCHSFTEEKKLKALVENGDIIVSAVGLPEHFKWDVPSSKYGEKIFIDVGINRNKDGKLCGDFDFKYLAAQGHYITPVPGGVGLLTRVTLLKHLIQ